MTLPIEQRTQCMHGVRLSSPCAECSGKSIEERRWMPSDELDGLALGAPEQEREMAKRWMDTAAQMDRNSHFWHKEAEKARTEAETMARTVQPSSGGLVDASLREVKALLAQHLKDIDALLETFLGQGARRDRLAELAMGGLLAGTGMECSAEHVTKAAYEQADSMLAARMPKPVDGKADAISAMAQEICDMVPADERMDKGLSSDWATSALAYGPETVAAVIRRAYAHGIIAARDKARLTTYTLNAAWQSLDHCIIKAKIIDGVHGIDVWADGPPVTLQDFCARYAGKQVRIIYEVEAGAPVPDTSIRPPAMTPDDPNADQEPAAGDVVLP